MKKRIYEILEQARPTDKASRLVHTFILILILCNVLAVILGSVQSLQAQYERLFVQFEIISVMVFTIEYLLRIWSCTVDLRYKSPFVGRAKFALTPLALIDLLAVVPFYLSLGILDLRVMRVMRFIRIFRILKIGRYSEAFRTLGAVIRGKRQELTATCTVLAVLLIVASTLMYETEHVVQPDKFQSIPAAMWWAIVTLTTVGYGDVFPITDLGRIFGSMIALLGIGMVALPTAIIGAGFVELMKTRKGANMFCPHCGKSITETE